MRVHHTNLSSLFLSLGLVVGCASTTEPVDESTSSAIEASAATPTIGPGLDVYRALAGEWLVVGEDGQPTSTVGLHYRVTSGGSAVVETVFPGEEHEMLTVYVEDEAGLMLTHYCVLQNQPSMRLQEGSTETHLIWDLSCCGNMQSEKDQHMHSAVVDLSDSDRIFTTWHMYQGGLKVEDHSMTLVRKGAD